jgi:hypothetical protein
LYGIRTFPARLRLPNNFLECLVLVEDFGDARKLAVIFLLLKNLPTSTAAPNRLRWDGNDINPPLRSRTPFAYPSFPLLFKSKSLKVWFILELPVTPIWSESES